MASRKSSTSSKRNTKKRTPNRPKAAAQSAARKKRSKGGGIASWFTQANTVRLQKIAGVVLLLLSVYTLLALVSHFFSGAADQSAGSLQYGAERSENIGGALGASLARLLVTRGYGIIALVVPPFLFLIGLAVLNPKLWRTAGRWLPYFFFGIHWVSALFDAINRSFKLGYRDLGGDVGNSLNDWMSYFVGMLGVWLILIITGTAFAIWQFNIEVNFFERLALKLDNVLPEKLIAKLRARQAARRADKAASTGTSTPDAEEVDLSDDAADSAQTAGQADDDFIVAVKKVNRDNQTAAQSKPKDAQKAPTDGEEPEISARPARTGQAHDDDETMNFQPPDDASQPDDASADTSADDEMDNFQPDAPRNKPKSKPKPNAKDDDPLGFHIDIPEGDEMLPETSTPESAYAHNLTKESEEEADKTVKAHKEEDIDDLPEQEDVADWEEYDPTKELSDYVYPTPDLLENHGGDNKRVANQQELEQNAEKIIEALDNFKIKVKVTNATVGPRITLFEIIPAAGVKISKIRNLDKDIALALAAKGIRIIAPLPGKGTIGIEIPNKTPEIVSFRSVISTRKFRDTEKALPIAIGKTISNEVHIEDLVKMPHLLVAGATGQGKSVGLNAIIASILYKKHPSQVKFVLIDPKQVEFSLYQVLKSHFLAQLPEQEEPIITDVETAVLVLNSLVFEMEERYTLLKSAAVRNIKEYNEKFINRRLNPQKGHRYLPYIVVVLDEFGDLMMMGNPKEVEVPITRLAQKARAIGIHLILATQRPSTNVITGIIKANFPARIAYTVQNGVDSKVILDTTGAEKLIGMGDMLLSAGMDSKRLQTPFIDTDEVNRLVNFIGDQKGYDQPYILPEPPMEDDDDDFGAIDLDDRDKLFEDAARLIVRTQQGSTSSLQRRFSIGYNRAGKITDQLEAAGVVGPAKGSKPRDVLIPTEAELERYLSTLE